MKQQSDEFDVLIIADSPCADLVPTTFNKPWALQKFGCFTLLDFCLEWVSWFDSPNVVVATLSLDEDTCEAVEERWCSQFHEKLRVVRLQNCFSINDMLREVASRRLLNGDFILIDNIATFCSSNLANQLPAFKSRLRQNKNNVLSLLYSPVESRERSITGFQYNSNKIVLYDSKHEKKNLFPIPKSFFVTETMVRSDLSPCGIALCALEFTDHFSGNYDFKTLDGIIQDIITNEEFLLQNIHMEMASDVTAFSADEYQSLLRAHSLLIKRTAFPLTFDNLLPYFRDFDRLEWRNEKNVYVIAGETAPSGAKDAVFGKGFDVHQTAAISETSFGTNATVGQESKVTNSIIGDSVRIGKDCSIEDCIIENDVTVGDGVHIHKNCIIGSNVTIPAGTVVENGSILQSLQPPNDLQKGHAENETPWHVTSEEFNGYHVWHLFRGSLQRQSDQSGRRSSLSSTCSSGTKNVRELNLEDEISDEPVDVVYQGNNKVFLSEVVDTMHSMERLGCQPSKEQMEKMKLEINASKLAYNIAPEDLSKNIFLAFLTISSDIRHSFKKLSELFIQWNALWLNYYKRDLSKMQLLHAIEEFANEDGQFSKIVPKFLQFLYNDEDFVSEEVLLEWYLGLPTDSHLIQLLKPLMEWIKTAEDESSDEG